MNIQEAFAVMREQYGVDRACAKIVGLTTEHYEALRNGRANIPKRTADYIILKAQEAASRASNDAEVSNA